PLGPPAPGEGPRDRAGEQGRVVETTVGAPMSRPDPGTDSCGEPSGRRSARSGARRRETFGQAFGRVGRLAPSTGSPADMTDLASDRWARACRGASDKSRNGSLRG